MAIKGFIGLEERARIDALIAKGVYGHIDLETLNKMENCLYGDLRLMDRKLDDIREAIEGKEAENKNAWYDENKGDV